MEARHARMIGSGMAILCPGCGRAYDPERFTLGRTLSCSCGARVGVDPSVDFERDAVAPRFAVDAMLGRLARWLRVLGLDASYEPDVADADLVRRAHDEHRWILTRDRALPIEWRVPRIHLVAAEAPLEQLAEVIRAFALDPEGLALFARCTRCNEPLVEIARERAAEAVPPRILQTNTRFHRCPCCGRIYWEGTHVDRMRRTLGRMLRPGA
jgi:uncharacterized protein with PIN domain